MNYEIQPIAIPGIHEKAFTFLESIVPDDFNGRILEIGAGHGAFTQKMYDK